MSAVVRLEVRNGALTVGDSLLMFNYPGALDWDLIPWPLVDEFRRVAELRDQLRVALLDARETGQLPSSCQTVELPDGSEFRLDAERPEQGTADAVAHGCDMQQAFDAIGALTSSDLGEQVLARLRGLPGAAQQAHIDELQHRVEECVREWL